MLKIVVFIDRWFLKPHPRLTSPEKIQRSRLLSAILLVLTLTGIIILFIVLHKDPNDINEPTVKGGILLVGLCILMYVVNRSGLTSVPAMGLILPLIANFIYIPFYSGESPVFLAFMMIPIILTAIFFSLHWTTITSAAILTLVAVLLTSVDQTPMDTPYWNLRNMWFFLLLATTLILTFIWHLGNMEKIRQRDLRRVNQELERKNAELERFSYTVSHDLKNPIITIKGFVSMLETDLKENRPDRIHDDYRRIANAADKMDALLSDLLEFSRIGRVINQPVEIELNQLVREALEMLDARIRSRNIKILVAPALPTIFGDRIRLREVFENLIANAIKFSGDQPAPIIEIGIRGEKAELVVFVKDNGIGIQGKFQEKIFGLFEKLNPSIEGTGVGLALAKRIIETHDGRIWVESEGLGKGSTFCFTVPDSRKNDL